MFCLSIICRKQKKLETDSSNRYHTYELYMYAIDHISIDNNLTTTFSLSLAIPGVAFILIICLVFILWRRKRWSNIFTYFLPRNTSSDIEDGNSYFGVPLFSYKDLEEATHNFDASKELGDGGYGAVYHGKCLNTHHLFM